MGTDKVKTVKAKAVKAKIITPSEEQEQVAVVNWLRANGVLCFHVPNGMKTNPITAARFKKMGVMAGIPDLCIVLDGGRVMWLEMKKVGKGRLSDAQKDVISRMAELDHQVYVCYGAKEAMAVCRAEGIVK
jgi:hypothetical protein